MDEAQKRATIYKAWGQLVTRAWADPKFKHELIANPKRHLEDLGVLLPEDIEITVVAETAKSFALHLPNAPEGPVDETYGGAVGNMPRQSSFGVCDDLIKKMRG